MSEMSWEGCALRAAALVKGESPEDDKNSGRKVEDVLRMTHKRDDSVFVLLCSCPNLLGN